MRHKKSWGLATRVQAKPHTTDDDCTLDEVRISHSHSMIHAEELAHSGRMCCPYGSLDHDCLLYAVGVRILFAPSQ